MGLAVTRANMRLYSFELSTIPESNLFDLVVTWQAPAVGGYSYVRSQVYTGVPAEDIVIDTEDLLVKSDADLDTAVWSISGDAPSDWITA